MSLFAFARAHGHAVRLSFSAVAVEDIDEGVARFASFVRERQAKSIGVTIGQGYLQRASLAAAFEGGAGRS
jgi:hypothetical protein